jgi:hypothetical protein
MVGFHVFLEILTEIVQGLLHVLPLRLECFECDFVKFLEHWHM